MSAAAAAEALLAAVVVSGGAWDTYAAARDAFEVAAAYRAAAYVDCFIDAEAADAAKAAETTYRAAAAAATTAADARAYKNTLAQWEATAAVAAVADVEVAR